MITDDEVMRVLEQANPASADDAIPMLDVAGYRDVLNTRNTTLTLIDNEPKLTQPSSGRRWPVLIATAAAVVLAIALVAIRDDHATPADQLTPTVTVPPTTPPRALLGAAPYPEQLVPGTYFLDGVGQSTTPRIFVTVGAGWSSGEGTSHGSSLSLSMVSGVANGDGGSMGFSRPDEEYSDACHWKDGLRPGGPATTLDGVVAALTEQEGWADVTAPSDISIDGYAGKAFQRTAPTDISDCDTTYQYRTRLSEPGMHPEFGHYEPGEIETVWVLDIDGTVVVINTRPYSDASAAARAEIAAVLDSIRIERA